MSATTIGVYLWTDRHEDEAENRLHLAHPHYVRAGWDDLFDDPDDAPSYHAVAPRVTDLIADSHPDGPIEDHDPVDQGSWRKLGEIDVADDGEITDATVEPCPECDHHIDSRDAPTDAERAAPFDHVDERAVYECEVNGEMVYHLGFGEFD